MSLFGGEEASVNKTQAYSGNQMQMFNQLIHALMGKNGQYSGGPRSKNMGIGGSETQSGGGYLEYFKNLLNPNGGQGDFENFAAPYRQQFEEETLPMISERFAGMGGGMGGALSSSGFGQALGGAGRGFNAQLAQLFASLRQHAAGQMAGLGQSALGAQPYALTTQPASAGAGWGLAGSALGSFLGPMGTAAGGALGNMFANGMKG